MTRRDSYHATLIIERQPVKQRRNCTDEIIAQGATIRLAPTYPNTLGSVRRARGGALALGRGSCRRRRGPTLALAGGRGPTTRRGRGGPLALARGPDGGVGADTALFETTSQYDRRGAVGAGGSSPAGDGEGILFSEATWIGCARWTGATATDTTGRPRLHELLVTNGTRALLERDNSMGGGDRIAEGGGSSTGTR